MPRGRHTCPGWRRAESPAASWLAVAEHATRRRTGRRRWPRRRRHRSRAGGAASSSCPDHRDVARVDAALTERARARAGTCGSPPTRGRRRATRPGSRCCAGHVSVVVGTRAAAFAPVRELGPGRVVGRRRRPARRAPGALPARPRRAPHAGRGRGRRGALGRLHPHAWRCSSSSSPASCAVASPAAGCGRGAAACRWPARASRSSATRPAASAHLPSDRVADRQGRPRVRAGPRAGAPPRLPALAVLPDLPRPAVRCTPLRRPGRRWAPARPSRPAGGAAEASAAFECRHCGGRELRSSVVGARRTAEELGRAFPGRAGAHLRRRRRARAGRRRPRPWSSRRPAPNRWPRAAMPRACCSTRGPGSTAPPWTRARRRCAAGWPPAR